MIRSKQFTTVSLFLCLLPVALWGVSVSGTGRAAEPLEEQKMINMDFDQVDLTVFIKFISKLTGKNFVVDHKVKGKVTILSPSPISVEEAYQVFLSVLEVNGLTTIPSGKVIKIVRTVESRQKNVQTEKVSGVSRKVSDRVVTRIIPLENAASNVLRKILVPMVSKQGLLVGYQPTETLILIDYESNVQRLLKIIRAVDVKPFSTDILSYSLEHATAERVTQQLKTLLSQGKKQGKGVQTGILSVIADERTNSVLVLADAKLMEKARQILNQLDHPTPEALSNIRVVPLENSQADELAQVLSSLAGKTSGKKDEAVISRDVSIVADKPSNSLVLIAEPKEFSTLMPIIEQLDAPRKQVFVEAAIIEVSSNADFNFGVDWHFSGAAGEGNENLFFGKGNSPPYGAGANLLNLPASLIQNTYGRSGTTSVGLLSFPFTATIGGAQRTFYGLGTFLQLSQTDNSVQIISTPQIMTMENEEAKVVIAENRPFITSREGETGTVSEFTNFEYKDIGVTLKLTPLINNQGMVKLDLYQEVSRIDPNVEFTTETPITRKRTAQTTVTVKDGQTVVIAGLMEKKASSTNSQVPGFGSIPLLGNLFKNRGNQDEKTNLMIFITPHIVETPQDARQLSYNKSRMLNRICFGVEGRVLPLTDDYLPFGLMP